MVLEKEKGGKEPSLLPSMDIIMKKRFMKEISKGICIMEREFLLGKVEVNMKVIL